MIAVASFINFQFDSVVHFGTTDEAKAYSFGLRRGYRLAQGSGPFYVAELPRDDAEMADVIPAGEIARLREALT